MICLDAVEVGTQCVVVAITADKSLKQRLKDFGFTPGTQVRCRYASPDRQTVAIEFKGTVVALRRSDLSGIQVQVHD